MPKTGRTEERLLSLLKTPKMIMCLGRSGPESKKLPSMDKYNSIDHSQPVASRNNAIMQGKSATQTEQDTGTTASEESAASNMASIPPPSEPSTPPLQSTQTSLSAWPAADFTTFSYKQALLNRIPIQRLLENGDLDVKHYIPFFIYDVLQFPGSLASLLGLGSSMDIILLMTPGELHGWKLNACKNGAPILTSSPAQAEDVVEGMLLFGKARRTFRALNAHYGDKYVAKATNVVFEVQGGAKAELRCYVWVQRQENKFELPIIGLAAIPEGKEEEEDVAVGAESRESIDEDDKEMSRLFCENGAGHEDWDSIGAEASDDDPTWNRPPWILEHYVEGRYVYRDDSLRSGVW